MNTQEVRTPRGNRRRKAVIDLNAEPGDQEGTSAPVRAPRVPTGNLQGESLPAQFPPTMIDLDAIEDDVIESSASAFAEVCSLYLLISRFAVWVKDSPILFLFDTRLKANRQVHVGGL